MKSFENTFLDNGFPSQGDYLIDCVCHNLYWSLVNLGQVSYPKLTKWTSLNTKQAEARMKR